MGEPNAPIDGTCKSPPTPAPTTPARVSAQEKILGAIKQSVANPKPTGPGKNRVPLSWK